MMVAGNKESVPVWYNSITASALEEDCTGEEESKKLLHLEVSPHSGADENQTRRRCLYFSVAIVAIALSILIRNYKAAAVLKRNENVSRPPPERTYHKATIPTLLSVVSAVKDDDEKGNELLFSLDNVLYDNLKGAVFVERDEDEDDDDNDDSSKGWWYLQPRPSRRRRRRPSITEAPQLRLDRSSVYPNDTSFTLSWTAGRDGRGRPLGVDDDVLILRCGSSRLNEDEANKVERERGYYDLVESNKQETKVLEAATIEQARATSDRNKGVTAGDGSSTTGSEGERNEWYFDRFPILRHEACQFSLYKRDDVNDNDGAGYYYHWMAESEPLRLVNFVTTPTAIHLALSEDPAAMVVNFVTGSVRGTPIAVYSEAATVTDPSKDGPERKVTGTTDTYRAEDMCQEPATVEEPGKFQPPGSLHSVRMTGLEPNTTYQYRVGLEYGQGVAWSETFHFTSPPPVQDDDDDNDNNGPSGARSGQSRPFSYLVYGDQGCPAAGWGQGGAWTAAMAAREIKSGGSGSNGTSVAVSQVHHVGDLSYAQGAAHVWDAWFDMIQPVAARVPLMVAVGNHEYDHETGGAGGKDPSGVLADHGYMPAWGDFRNDSQGECGVPVSKRFTMPQSGTSNGVFWYSFDYGNVHTAVLSSEHDLSPGSPQHDWLQRDLASVDRDKQPWIVVEAHRPLYEGEAVWKENAVGIGMRYSVEDLLVDYQVDLVLAGHYHAYHRTCDGLYRSKCNNGGPTHITVGTAGARLDDVGLFPNRWTAKYIRGQFGYGRITVVNSTALRFEFVKAGDENDPTAGDVRDEVWIVRDR